MADTNIVVLSILTHYFQMCHKTAEAARKFRGVEGDDRISDLQYKTGSNTLKEKLLK